MALTDVLGLETHPDGTVGVNAIVTGNWSRIEKVFGTVETLGATGGIVLDAGEERNKALGTLTGDVTFSTSNLIAGRHMMIRVPNGGTLRNLTFPGGWTFIGGAAPASIDANKTALLELFVWGNADGEVEARWTAQP